MLVLSLKEKKYIILNTFVINQNIFNLCHDLIKNDYNNLKIIDILFTYIKNDITYIINYDDDYYDYSINEYNIVISKNYYYNKNNKANEKIYFNIPKTTEIPLPCNIYKYSQINIFQDNTILLCKIIGNIFIIHNILGINTKNSNPIVLPSLYDKTYLEENLTKIFNIKLTFRNIIGTKKQLTKIKNKIDELNLIYKIRLPRIVVIFNL